MTAKKKLVTRKIGNVVCALVMMIAPVVSGYCRSLFYQPEEPEGLEKYTK